MKALPLAARAADLHLHGWFCKFSACRTSEWTTGAPMAETALALAAVDFVGTRTWGLDWARV